MGFFGLYQACYLGLSLLIVPENSQNQHLTFNDANARLLLLGIYPKWPSNSCDSSFPQFFRHLITHVFNLKENNNHNNFKTDDDDDDLDLKLSQKCNLSDKIYNKVSTGASIDELLTMI